MWLFLKFFKNSVLFNERLAKMVVLFAYSSHAYSILENSLALDSKICFLGRSLIFYL